MTEYLDTLICYNIENQVSQTNSDVDSTRQVGALPLAVVPRCSRLVALERALYTRVHFAATGVGNILRWTNKNKHYTLGSTAWAALAHTGNPSVPQATSTNEGLSSISSSNCCNGWLKCNLLQLLATTHDNQTNHFYLCLTIKWLYFFNKVCGYIGW